MRIGFNARHLSDPEVRGLTRYTICLLRALSEMPGIELVLFSIEPPCREHLQGIRAKTVNFECSREFLWNNHALPDMIRRHEISVFHAPADRGLPLYPPCPSIVTVHGSYERSHWNDLYLGVKNKLSYWVQEWANHRADAVVTVSDTTRQELIKLGIAPPEKLYRTYLAAAPEFVPESTPLDHGIRHLYGINSTYVLYVGGYSRWKNVEGLVLAFERSGLRDQLLVVVAKHRWDYPRLYESWKSLSCFPRLRLIDPLLEHIPALYRGADLFVNPSKWESFGLPLVEAMACGTPILCSNRGAMPEIVGNAALLFDPENIEELAWLMSNCLIDGRLKKDLRDRGLSRAKTFSWAFAAEQTLQIYRNLVGIPRPC